MDPPDLGIVHITLASWSPPGNMWQSPGNQNSIYHFPFLHNHEEMHSLFLSEAHSLASRSQCVMLDSTTCPGSVPGRQLWVGSDPVGSNGVCLLARCTPASVGVTFHSSLHPRL